MLIRPQLVVTLSSLVLINTLLGTPHQLNAQGFTPNNGHNLTGIQTLVIEGNSDLTILSGNFMPPADFRNMHLRVVAPPDGWDEWRHFTLEELRVDFNGDGIWDSDATYPVFNWTYPDPAPGTTVTHDITIGLVYTSPDTITPIIRQLTFPFTVLGKPRVYTDSNNNVLVQVRDEDCTNKVPVLMVEGFDPLNQGFPGPYYLLAKTLIDDDLYPTGHEVFLLNFGQGGADVRENADVVLSALAKIHQLCPNNEIALAGLSMGGVVARYALAKAEHHSVPHHVGLYVSYDSPHRHAHVSPGLQGKIKNATGNNLVLESFKSLLQSQAAKQLLIHNTYDFDPPDAHAVRDTFDSWLTRLNGDGYPDKSYNVAITNAAASNGVFLSAYDEGDDGTPLARLQIISGGESIPIMDVSAVPLDLGAGSIFDSLRFVRYGDLFSIPFFANVDYRFSVDFDPVFIPTWSALDLREPVVTDQAGNITSHQGSPFDDYVAQNVVRLKHSALTTTSRASPTSSGSERLVRSSSASRS